MDSSHQKNVEAEQLERLVNTTGNIQRTLQLLFGNVAAVEGQEVHHSLHENGWKKEE